MIDATNLLIFICVISNSETIIVATSDFFSSTLLVKNSIMRDEAAPIAKQTKNTVKIPPSLV